MRTGWQKEEGKKKVIEERGWKKGKKKKGEEEGGEKEKNEKGRGGGEHEQEEREPLLSPGQWLWT